MWLVLLLQIGHAQREFYIHHLIFMARPIALGPTLLFATPAPKTAVALVSGGGEPAQIRKPVSEPTEAE